MDSKKKKIGTIMLIAVGILITAVTFVSEVQLHGIESLRLSSFRLRPVFFLGALLCLAGTMFFESLKFYILLRESGHDRPELAYETAAFGRYYDCLTPSGVGGQPYQIYHLSSNGIGATTSCAVTVAGFIALQFAFVLLALISVAAGVKLLEPGYFVGMKIAIAVGLVCYIATPVTLLILSLHPALAVKFVNFVIRVLSRIRICKDPERVTAKINGKVEEYRTGFRFMLGKKGMWLRTIGCGIMYHVCMAMMPYFVIKGFGGNIGFAESIIYTVLMYAAITFIPTPGNAGAAEGSFYMLFSTVSDVRAFWPMMVWRVFCYYSYLVIGVATHAVCLARAHKSREV